MNTSEPVLSADYNSPNGSHTFQCELPKPEENASSQTTLFLFALRSGTIQLQQDINSFLTARMEEDKMAAEKVGEATRSKEEEAKDEDNYGEEIDDDE